MFSDSNGVILDYRCNIKECVLIYKALLFRLTVSAVPIIQGRAARIS